MTQMKMTLDDGQVIWYDPEKDKEEKAFYDQKERELYHWIFSGQRTIDMFGKEGAKLVLEEQDKLEREQHNKLNVRTNTRYSKED